MSGYLKIALWVLGGLIALFAAAAIAVTLLFDPNDYREDIGRLVEERTGRELVISGDISLRVFPWFAVAIGETRLGNAEGFGTQPMAKISSVEVGIKLLPLLLRREVEMSTVRLEGLALNLAVDESGRNNWSDLIEAAEEPEPELEPRPDEDRRTPVRSLSITAVELVDAALVYDDRQAGTRYSLDRINLSTGALRPGEPFNLRLALVAAMAEPALTAEIDLVGMVNGDLESGEYAVDKLKLNVLARGESLPAGRQQLSLAGDATYQQDAGDLDFRNGRLNVGGLMVDVALRGRELTGETPRLSGSLKTERFSPRAVAGNMGIELPPARDSKTLTRATLSAQYEGDFKSAHLRNLNLSLDDTTITGTVSVTDLAAQALALALKVDQIDLDRYLPPEAAPAVAGKDPERDINAIEIPVEMLEALNAEGSIDVARLKIQGLTLEDVQIKLHARPGREKRQEIVARAYGGKFEATTRMRPGTQPGYTTAVRLQTVDFHPLIKDLLGQDLLSGIGSLSMDLTGSGTTVGDVRRTLNGDIAMQLRDGAVKGFNVAHTIRAAQAGLRGEQLAGAKQQQTDFASLSATARIVNGVLQSDDLDGRNPLLRLAGGGRIDLVQEQIDYTARPTIAQTLTGQDGDRLEDLRGLTIPIRLTGSLYQPRVRVDLETALKQRATQELRERVAPREEELKERVRREVEKHGGEGAAEALRDLFRRPRDRQPPPQEPDQEETEKEEPGSEGS